MTRLLGLEQVIHGRSGPDPAGPRIDPRTVPHQSGHPGPRRGDEIRRATPSGRIDCAAARRRSPGGKTRSRSDLSVGSVVCRSVPFYLRLPSSTHRHSVYRCCDRYRRRQAVGRPRQESAAADPCPLCSAVSSIAVRTELPFHRDSLVGERAVQRDYRRDLPHGKRCFRDV